MQTLTLSEFSKAVEGQLYCPANLEALSISEVVTDSRTFFKANNSVFFALIGPTNNGHHYVAQLLKKGLQIFVVSDKNVITSNAVFILVKNTTKALQQLATFNRSKFSNPIIGITGIVRCDYRKPQ